MARGLSSSFKTELATGNINPVHLVHFNFATPLYITDCGYDLTSSISGTSRTYTASGHLLGISGVAEGTEPIKNTLSIVLSGVDQSYISVALNENIINSSVQIYRALLNSSNAIISDPFLIYDGTIDDYIISDDTNNSQITINITSHWGNFEKVSGRRTSDVSQQRHFSGDKGMAFSSLTIRDVKWGRS